MDGGLLLLGDFNNEGVTCATGPKAIFLPSSDTQFNRKLSVALTAFTMEKRIEVLIGDPIATNCVAVSAVGNIPIAYFNYWHLKQ